jgi:hypothetical protein
MSTTETDNELAEALAELQAEYQDLGKAFDKRTKALLAVGLAFTDSGELIVVDRVLALSDFDEEGRP